MSAEHFSVGAISDYSCLNVAMNRCERIECGNATEILPKFNLNELNEFFIRNVCVGRVFSQIR